METVIHRTSWPLRTNPRWCSDGEYAAAAPSPPPSRDKPSWSGRVVRPPAKVGAFACGVIMAPRNFKPRMTPPSPGSLHGTNKIQRPIVWLADRAISGQRRMDETVQRHTSAAGRHLAGRLEISRQRADIENRQDGDREGDRAPGGPAARGAAFLQTMRGLCQWAKHAKLTEHDPTIGLNVERPETDGYHVWTEEECATFESRWPRGTRERLAFDLLLYTGLRRGDAVRLGRPHLRNGIATIRTEKTGETVTIPILPPFQESGDFRRLVAGMTLAEINRMIRAAIRAARKEGAAVVEVTIGDEAIVRIPLAPDKPIAEPDEVGL
jgi:hypothetical protein